MYLPMPFKGTDELTYVVEQGNEFWLNTEWDFATMVEDRHFYTAGVGYIFNDMIALDVAISRGGFERTTTWFSDKRVTTEMVASLAYRF
jgi:hypothetical protein